MRLPAPDNRALDAVFAVDVGTATIAGDAVAGKVSQRDAALPVRIEGPVSSRPTIPQLRSGSSPRRPGFEILAILSFPPTLKERRRRSTAQLLVSFDSLSRPDADRPAEPGGDIANTTTLRLVAC